MTKRKTKKSGPLAKNFIDFANHKPLLIDPKDYRSSKFPEARSKLRKLLDCIIEEKRLTDSEEIQYFIGIRKRYLTKHKVSNGKLIETMELDPAAYKVQLWTYPEFLRNIIFNLIDFLTSSEKNIKKIKKCEMCKDYFISEKYDNRIKYCPICSPKNKMTKEQKTEYTRKWRTKQRELRIARIREEQVERFLTVGYSKEEAEELWEEYKEENKL